MIQRRFDVGIFEAIPKSKSIHALGSPRWMIARPKMSQIEWETIEIRGFKKLELSHPFFPQVAPYAARMVLCGPLLGLAVGHLVSALLSFIYEDACAEITLTIAAAYGTYVLAEMVTVGAGRGRELRTAPLSVVFQSFPLMFRRAIISRNGLEA